MKHQQTIFYTVNRPDASSKKFPSFWKVVIENSSPVFRNIVQKEEYDLLKYLEDIRFEMIPFNGNTQMMEDSKFFLNI